MRRRMKKLMKKMAAVCMALALTLAMVPFSAGPVSAVEAASGIRYRRRKILTIPVRCSR